MCVCVCDLGRGLIGIDYNSQWIVSLIVIRRYSEVLEYARKIKGCDQRRVFLRFRVGGDGDTKI